MPPGSGRAAPWSGREEGRGSRTAIVCATPNVWAVHLIVALVCPPWLPVQVLETLKDPLQTLIQGREPEVVFAVLSNFLLLAQRYPLVFSQVGGLTAAGHALANPAAGVLGGHRRPARRRSAARGGARAWRAALLRSTARPAACPWRLGSLPAALPRVLLPLRGPFLPESPQGEVAPWLFP